MSERRPENHSQYLIEIARTAIRDDFPDPNLRGLMVLDDAARRIANPDSIVGISLIRQAGQKWFWDELDARGLCAIPKTVVEPFLLDDPEAFHSQIVQNFLTPSEQKRLDFRSCGGQWNKPRFDAWVIVARTQVEEIQLTTLVRNKIEEVKTGLPHRSFEGLKSLAGILKTKQYLQARLK